MIHPSSPFLPPRTPHLLSSSQLHFPTRINLKPYTKEGLAADPRIANKMTEVDDEKREEFPDSHYEYVLRGVVVHTGTAGGGHYYSFVQERLPTNLESPDDGWVSGRWVELNDHLARPFDPSQIPEECFGGMETIIPSNPINAVGQRSQSYPATFSSCIIVSPSLCW